jgi:hypothetical protein
MTKVIEPLWSSKPETANRLRGRIETVLNWAADRLGIEVREVGFPKLDRFAFLKKFGVPLPSYSVPSRPVARKKQLR